MKQNWEPFRYRIVLPVQLLAIVHPDFVPIRSFDKEFIKFEKEFDTIFEKVDLLNREYYDDEFPEYILGWGRNSLYNELEPNLIDKKNHLYFQSATNPNSFFMIFDHVDLSIGLGFTLYTFKDEFKSINIASELIELRSNFSKDVLLDDLVELAITIEEKRKTKEPLLKGLEET